VVREERDTIFDSFAARGESLRNCADRWSSLKKTLYLSEEVKCLPIVSTPGFEMQVGSLIATDHKCRTSGSFMK
jgi:hypothetical protein